MTKVLSIRIPPALERAIHSNAARSNMPVADIVRLILMHAPGGQYSFSALRDVREYLDAKLDVRLPEELVSRLRAEAERLRISVSVYSRIVLNAYYAKRLVFVETGDDRYTLAENHEQTKSA
jgi:predicted HicB family RNase H-like nuclease